MHVHVREGQMDAAVLVEHLAAQDLDPLQEEIGVDNLYQGATVTCFGSCNANILQPRSL